MASRPRISSLRLDSSDWIEMSCAALAAVDRQALDKPDSRIPMAQFVAILAEAERRSGDPFIGVHAGEPCEPRDSSLRSCSQRFQQLGRLVRSSP